MSKTRVICAVAGLLSLIGAAVMAWVVTPNWVARVPAGRESDRNYEGTFQTLLDPAALASGDLLHAVKSGAPLAILQRVKVEATSGGKALVSDTRTTSAAGAQVEQTRWEYAVDRTSLEAVASHPSSWNVVPAQGLTVNWPFGAEKKTYQGWSPETKTTSPLTYVRSETKAGITTYVYQADLPPTRIVDEQILAGLPKALPQSLLKLLGQAGALPAAQAAQLAEVLPKLPDPVPLAYTFQDHSTFWVDPSTGLVIDLNRTQQRVAEIALPGAQPVPLLPAVAVAYHETAASSAHAADDARHGRTVIRWCGVYIPFILLGLGVVLLVLAALARGGGRRGRGSGSGSGSGSEVPAAG